jgi:tetratricopeptide (TPR) repeat protein
MASSAGAPPHSPKFQLKPLKLILSVLALALTACQASNPIPLTSAALDSARAAAQAGDWEECWDLLIEIESENLDRATLVDFSRLAGDAAWETNNLTASIRYYETYLKMRGPGADSLIAEQRLFQVGNEMLEGKHRTFGLFSNRYRGRVTLQNLAGWSPLSPYAPEALATVAEFSFSRGRYDDAAIDYQLLLSKHRNSAYGDLAVFRLGMCGYHSALDAPTNRPLIMSSANQLQQYLSMYPNGLYLNEAQQALARLHDLNVAYFRYLGDYYAKIGNQEGAQKYYQQADRYAKENSVP